MKVCYKSGFMVFYYPIIFSGFLGRTGINLLNNILFFYTSFRLAGRMLALLPAWDLFSFIQKEMV